MSQTPFIKIGSRYVNLSQILSFEASDDDTHLVVRMSGCEDLQYFYKDTARQIVRAFKEACDYGFVRIFEGNPS